MYSGLGWFLLNSNMYSCESDSFFLNRLFYWWMLKNGFDYCSLLLGRHACLWMDLLNFMVSFLSAAHPLCSPLEWLYRPLLNFHRKAWALMKYRYSQPLLPHKISSRFHQPWSTWGAPWEVKVFVHSGCCVDILLAKEWINSPKKSSAINNNNIHSTWRRGDCKFIQECYFFPVLIFELISLALYILYAKVAR